MPILPSDYIGAEEYEEERSGVRRVKIQETLRGIRVRAPETLRRRQPVDSWYL